MSNSLRPHGMWPARLLCPWDSPGRDTRVGCHALPQGIFPTQGSNPGLPHCRQILYHLSRQENPRILEWIAHPSSRGTSRPRDLNRGLLHCRRILYQLSHQGSIAAAVTSPLIRGELAAPWDKLSWTDPEFKVMRGRQWPLTIRIQKPCLWNLVNLHPSDFHANFLIPTRLPVNSHVIALYLNTWIVVSEFLSIGWLSACVL